MTETPDDFVISNSIAIPASDSRESFLRRSEKERAIRRMEPVLAFLQNNFHRNPRLKEIAAEVNLSPSRLSHLFKAAIGIPTDRYLKRLRLQYAKRLLKEGSLTIKEVAAQSGFSNQSHFSHEFKKAAGLSPSEYRGRHLGNRFYHVDLSGETELHKE